MVGAIDAGIDLLTDSDISQDFFIDDIFIVAPAGATHLFLAPLDGFTADNVDSNGDFALRVTVVPEPAGTLLWLTGAIPISLRRRKQVFC